MTVAKSDRWVIVRSRVSLVGRVTVADAGAAHGGMLCLTGVPATQRHNARSTPNDNPRRYHTRIRGDGFYFFLDLPTGEYVLAGQDEGANKIEAQPVSIPPRESLGPSFVVRADLTASPKPVAHEQRREERVLATSAKRRRGSRGTLTDDPHA